MMIELQTLVGELTIAEFTKLCGMIGAIFFILYGVTFIVAKSVYDFFYGFFNYLFGKTCGHFVERLKEWRKVK